MKYLITGAGSGLGLALAQEVQSQGHTVLALSRQDWDVRYPSTFIDSGFDRVIVNAAIKDEFTALSTEPDAILDVLNVNAVGAIRTVQSVRNCMNPGCKIIFLTSQMGSSALTGGITLHGRYGDHYIKPTYSIGYRMSKAALNKLAQCLALDLQPLGYGVWALDPGWPQTKMGGQFATMPVVDCARSIISTIESLDIEETGQFIDWNGNLLDW